MGGRGNHAALTSGVNWGGGEGGRPPPHYLFCRVTCRVISPVGSNFTEPEMSEFRVISPVGSNSTEPKMFEFLGDSSTFYVYKHNILSPDLLCLASKIVGA